MLCIGFTQLLKKGLHNGSECIELKELGVPCALCYVSHWMRGLAVYGDPRMTLVIREQADKILEGLQTELSKDDDESALNLLPLPLPTTLQELNCRTL